MQKQLKLKLLNCLLARGSAFANNIYADATFGISQAINNGDMNVSIEVFAKRILKLYDEQAKVEVIDFEDKYFDELFAINLISDAAKRLSGYQRGILVVSSLDKAGMKKGNRFSQKRRIDYAQNLETIENYILRYKDAFENLEIIFL